MVKNPPANAGDAGLIPESGRPLQPTAVFLAGKSHEQRRLVGYSLQGHQESNMMKWQSTQILRVLPDYWTCILHPGKQSSSVFFIEM